MRPLRWLGGVVVTAGLLTGGLQVVYADKAYPNVSVGGAAIGGRTSGDIARIVSERAVKELKFTYQGQTFTVSGESIDLAYDPAATGRAALAAGRENWLEQLVGPIGILVGGRDVDPVYTFNRTALMEQIRERTEPLQQPAVGATVVRSGTTFQITPERDGSGIEPQAGIVAARESIQAFTSAVTLRPAPEKALVTRRDATAAKAYAGFLSSRPLTVAARDKQESVPTATLAGWVTFRTVEQTDTPAQLRNPLLGSVNNYFGVSRAGLIGSELSSRSLVADLDRAKVGEFVGSFAERVDSPPVNARLAFADGALKISGAPRDGIVVDRGAAVTEIQAAARRTDRTATLPVSGAKAEIREETIPTLGITTLIGRSTTTFGGSPANRTYNISVGAERFDGILIKPGEEFSFNQTLGDVGPETGYRPELVIKENKTVPEYGGGLCQVSTTMFRAAMDAGLPITDRSNHSYAVHYYAPIGMDATIYPPDPDMKFKNNTKGYILVQTSMSGQSLTYEFYGTDDGRQARTEVIHINASEEAGGTASFRYVVDGGPDPIDRVFSSSYQPRSKFPVGGQGSLN